MMGADGKRFEQPNATKRDVMVKLAVHKGNPKKWRAFESEARKILERALADGCAAELLMRICELREWVRLDRNGRLMFMDELSIMVVDHPEFTRQDLAMAIIERDIDDIHRRLNYYGLSEDEDENENESESEG